VPQLLNLTRNLGVIFDSSLTMSDHISSVSKSCFLSICALRRIRNNLNFTTAKTIATSLVHTKADYIATLPRSQLDRVQVVLNSAARAVSRTPRFTHISLVLESLHWLKFDQRIHYKILSIIQKTLQSRNSYLHNLLRIQSDTCTRSSTLVTLKRSTVCSRLEITETLFTHRAPVLWNARL
jgi:hypothetical protein